MDQLTASDDGLTPELRAKRDRLFQLLESFGSCAVAYSGGLDSAVLAYAAHRVLNDRAVAVLGRSASLASVEDAEARRLAEQIGIRLETIETQELERPEYRANLGDRCYHCKTELFVKVEQLAARVGAAVVAGDGTVYAGCNVECASYGLSLCAERAAIAQAVAAGSTRIRALVVVSEAGAEGTPCGACRQWLAELGQDDLEVGRASCRERV